VTATQMGHHHRYGLMAFAVSLALATFIWPAARLAPRGLPVGVVGSAPAALRHDAGFDTHRYVTAVAAEQAIRDRTIYGALDHATTYVATAASPAVAAALRQASPSNHVVDLAPGTRRDPRAATLAALVLPLVIVGIFVAALCTSTTRLGTERLVAIAGGALLSGVVAALLADTWLGAIPGSWLGLAGAVALTVLAVATVTAGLAAHFGPPGLGAGAIVLMVVGNAWSGVSSAPELLPQPAQALGKLFPPGAAGELLRSTGWFDGAGSASRLGVLAVWSAVGISLLSPPLARRAKRDLGAITGRARA
jgi:hypothetical protein